jgi:autotransporter translocation and assembly factor TamB
LINGQRRHIPQGVNDTVKLKKPKKKYNVFAVILISFFGLLYVLNLLVDNPYTHQFVNYYLNEKIVSQLPMSIHYESMKVQLLPPSVSLFGLKASAKDRSGFDSELVELSQVQLSVSIWSLFLAKPQLGDLELMDLKANWPPPDNFLMAFEKLTGERQKTDISGKLVWPPQGLPPVANLRLHNAQLHVAISGLSINVLQDPNEVTYVDVAGLNGDVDFRSWKDAIVNVDAAMFNLSDRSLTYIEDAKVELRGRLKGYDFTASHFSIDSKRVRSQGDLVLEFETKRQGPLSLLTGLVLKSTQNTDGDFSILGSFLDLPGTYGAISAHSETRLEIPLLAEDPAASRKNGEEKKKAKSGELSSAVKLEVKVSGKSHSAALDQFNFYDSEAEMTIDLNGITFHDVRIMSREKSYGRAKGTLAFNEAVDYDFTGQLFELPMSMLLGVFNVGFDALDLGLSSDKVTLKGKGDPFHMSVSGQTTLSQIVAPTLHYNHDLFPVAPSCRTQLALAIDKSGINFESTDGVCGILLDKQLQARAPLNFSGTTTFNDKTGLDLRIRLGQISNLDFLNYFTQQPLTGTGDVDVHVKGPYSRVNVGIQSKLSNVQMDQWGLGEVKFLGDMSSTQLTIKELTAVRDGGRLQGLGHIKFDDQIFSELKVEAADLPSDFLEGLIASFSDHSHGLTGAIKNLRADVKGPLLQPFQYRGDLSIQITNGKTMEQSYFDDLSLNLEATDQSILLTDTRLQLGSLEGRISGSLYRKVFEKNPDGIDAASSSCKKLLRLGLSCRSQLNFDVHLPKVEEGQDQLQRLPVLGALSRKGQVEGTISGNLKFTGKLDDVVGFGKIRMDHVRIYATAVPAVLSNLTLEGGRLNILADQAGNAVKGRFDLDLMSENLRYSWYLAAKNYDLRMVLPNAISSDPRNFVYISGSWESEGELVNWWNSNGILQLKQVRAKLFLAKDSSRPPLDIVSESEFVLKSKLGNWVGDPTKPLALKSELGRIQLSVNSSAMPSKMNLQLLGRAQVEVLRMLIPRLEIATGQVHFDGSIFGGVTDPDLDIRFSSAKLTAENSGTWQPLVLGSADFRPPVKDIQLEGRVLKSGVEIKKLSGEKGSGRVSMSGFYAFDQSDDGVTDLNIDLKGASFLYPFPIVKNFDTVIDASVNITNQDSIFAASGRIDVKRARSNRDIDIRSVIVESLRASSANRSGPNSLEPNVGFDLMIYATDSISFSSRTIQAQLSSNLRLQGTDINPELTGLVEVKKGKFLFKRDFFVRRGLINFDDPIKPDPTLDISATSEVGNYSVVINLTGRASDPLVDFAVDPPTRSDGSVISKLEIITLLSRGSLPDSQVNGIGNAESTVTAEVLNLLAGQVENQVQTVFDLSGQNIIRQVYIDTYARPDGKPVARFNLPLSVTDDLGVVLQVDQSTVKLSSEYALHDGIALTGGVESTNDDTTTGGRRQVAPAETGVDVKFKFAFP